jgi:hypothetical protein
MLTANDLKEHFGKTFEEEAKILVETELQAIIDENRSLGQGCFSFNYELERSYLTYYITCELEAREFMNVHHELVKVTDGGESYFTCTFTW